MSAFHFNVSPAFVSSPRCAVGFSRQSGLNRSFAATIKGLTA